MAIYWFAILFIVAAAIVYMVSSFYGKPYDVRDIEANLLADRVVMCMSEGGYIQQGFLDGSIGQNFLEDCNLNFNTEDTYGWDNDQYYLEVNISKFNSFEQPFFTDSEGNVNLKDFCELKGDNLPYCVLRKFYIIDAQQNQYEADVLSIVRKTEKNVQ